MDVRAARCWGWLLAAAWCALPAWGDDANGTVSPLATLPQSNEALVLSSHVEQAIHAGDYRNAIELIERIRSLPDALVAAPASRTYYPVWRQTFFLQGRLPPEGVALYRQLHDAAVGARAAEAVEAADVDALRGLFRTHRLSTHWAGIGEELAAFLLDRGEFGEAIEVLRELEWAGAPRAANRRMQLAVALERVGARRAALDLIDRLATDGVDPQRVETLRAWLQRGPRTRDEAVGPNTFYIGGRLHWETILESSAAGRRDRAEALLSAMDFQHRLALLEPATGADALAYRVDGRVHVIDTLALTHRWSATEITAPQGGGPFSTWGGGAQDGDTQLLLTNHLRHVLAMDERRVYTIESLSLEPPNVEPLGRQPFSVERQLAQRNELVARDLKTGRMVWRTGQDAGSPLYDVEFQDRPIVSDGTLFVPYRRGDDLLIGEVDAGAGTLVRERKVVGPPTHFTRSGGRCLLAADETTLYLGTGNGVIAALRREGLDWRWATVYPSTVAEYLGRLWWKPPVRPRESGVDRPILADDLIVWGPMDSLSIFALDRFSGRQRWRISRRDYAYIVGAVAGGLIVGGNGLTCLDLQDPAGSSPRWRSAALDIVGRPVVRDGLVFVPARDGLVVLDGVTGKVVRDEWSPAAASDSADSDMGFPEPTALVVDDDAVYAVSPLRVRKYPAPNSTRRRCEVLAAREAFAADAVLARAWLDALQGRLDEALASLSSLEPGDDGEARARNRLLTQVYLALADRDDAGAARLDWLRRALSLAESPALAARLHEEIADSLARERDWPALFDHLGDMIQLREPSYVELPGGAERAAWLSAVSRLRALSAQPGEGAPADVRRALVERFVDDEDVDARVLLRLFLALDGGAGEPDVALRLLMSDLPPELRARFIAAAMQADVTSAQERLRALRAWEVLVAVDRLEEAAAARAAWRSAEQSGAEIDDAERDRAAAVEIAEKKLELGRGAPFGEQLWRQWRARSTELILDPHRIRDADRRWQLVRDQENREIQLIDVVRHEYARRKTPDTLSGAARNASPSFSEHLLMGGLRRDAGGASRPFWPAARYGALAAIPTPGGLIGFGLGPERSGGRRLWDMPIADWDSFPDEFGDVSAAGPLGVYFMPRSDRVALVGWADGEVWWRSRVQMETIERLLLAGDTLVAITGDHRVLFFDALTGGPPRPLELETASALGATVVGETLVVWGRSFAAAFEPASGRRVWVTSASGLSQQYAPVAGRPWLLLKAADTPLWRVLDVEGGRFVEALGDIGRFSSVTGAVVEGERLYVAGAVDGDDGEQQAVMTYDAADGKRVWAAPVASRVAIHAGQLRAHRDFIPVLLHQEDQDTDGDRFEAAPAIRLIRKHDGSTTPIRTLAGDYQSVPSACDLFLFATETRIIVQVDGNLVAYGRSALSKP